MATNARAIGPLTRQVAAEIRATRARLKLTQDALAMATGIPANSLSQMENGKMAIDVEQIERIALAFGIPPEKFFAAALSNARADTHAGLANQGSGGERATPRRRLGNRYPFAGEHRHLAGRGRSQPRLLTDVHLCAPTQGWIETPVVIAWAANHRPECRAGDLLFLRRGQPLARNRRDPAARKAHRADHDPAADRRELTGGRGNAHPDCFHQRRFNRQPVGMFLIHSCNPVQLSQAARGEPRQIRCAQVFRCNFAYAVEQPRVPGYPHASRRARPIATREGPAA
jgi:transcriptional regulator with XRE-family HTH domain